jgi:mRNA interferase RelE/StbE
MYSIRVKKKAEKQLAALPSDIAGRIVVAIDGLVTNPRSANSTKLQGYTNVYRIRVGNYRIIYSIEDAILTIEIIKIAHRQSVYNRL